jgi:protein ImuB
MAFASIYVPNFILQAVLRAEPHLVTETNSHAEKKPHADKKQPAKADWRDEVVALIEGEPPLCRVVAMSARAAQAGIELGMAKANAEQFAGVEIRERSRMQEKSAHAALLDIGWSISPRIEETAQDAVAIDVAGLGHLFSSGEEIGAQVVARARECGLAANAAIAANVETALIAARGFAGVTVIPRGEEAKYLSALPVDVLLPAVFNSTGFPPEQISEALQMSETLQRWGVRTCGAFAELPVLGLSERLGQEGVRLHALARGVNDRSLAIAEAADFFEEEMELDDAVEELEPLSFLLGRLLGQLCARLSARALAAGAIRVRFELQPAFENAFRPRQELFREKKPPGVYERTLQLPVPGHDAKMLLKLLRLRLQADAPKAPIQTISVVAEAARPRAMQSGLFMPSFPDPEKLEVTIARIANVVGQGNVGAPALVDTHRPGEFRLERFWVVEAAEMKRSVRRKEKDAAQTADQRAAQRHFGEVEGASVGGAAVERSPALAPAAASFRMFRPSMPARVELREGRPCAVIFQGERGEVMAASGPWRTSGEWWREDQWQQDEWDLEIKFAASVSVSAAGVRSRECPGDGIYRVYYDALRRGWFVRGIYD